MKTFLLFSLLTIPVSATPILYLDGITASWSASAEQQEQVRKMVESRYVGLNVIVQLSDPGDRKDVAWVIIGGTSPMPGEVGMAPINVWHFGTTYRPFGVAFSANVYPDGFSLIDVAEACAHEPGHLFGLFHSTDPTDIMWPYVDGTMHTFNAANRLALESIVGVSQLEDLAVAFPEPQLSWLAPVLLMRRRRR